MVDMVMPPRLADLARAALPVTARFAARVPPWGTLHHVGRRSGDDFETPLLTFAARAPIEPGQPISIASHRDILVLHPMLFGTDVDWCRNARAAGSYRLTRRGVDYRVDELRLLDVETGLRILSPGHATVSRLLSPDAFLAGRLHLLR
jgi:hypothetical protein